MPASTAPSAAPARHDRVHLVDEDHVAALRLGDLLEHRLHAFLELAPVLGAREHRGDVELEEPLVRERGGDVARDHALGEPLDDRGLPHPGLADQHRVVLGAAREDLDHPPDLLVPADHLVELPLARERGEVAAVALKHAVFLIGALVGDPVAAAHRVECLAHRVLPRAGLLEETRGVVLPAREPEEEVLGRDVLVAQLPCLLLRLVQRPVQLAREARLGAPLDARVAAKRLLDALPDHRNR